MWYSSSAFVLEMPLPLITPRLLNSNLISFFFLFLFVMSSYPKSFDPSEDFFLSFRRERSRMSSRREVSVDSWGFLKSCSIVSVSFSISYRLSEDAVNFTRSLIDRLLIDLADSRRHCFRSLQATFVSITESMASNRRVDGKRSSVSAKSFFLGCWLTRLSSLS